MSGDQETKGDTLPAAILKSKSGEKLADAVKDAVGLGHNIVDYFAGGDRVRQLAQARADAALIETQSQVAVDELRAQAAHRLLEQELRNQRNIDAITKEAFKALPPPDAKISDEPVSEDFIFRFFDECKGVGDPEMQQIWAKLLVGEVVRPGSFHPRTLRIVKDMTSDDAKKFSTLCRFVWQVDGPTPLIFSYLDAVYVDNGVTFDLLSHLNAIGLVALNFVTGFGRNNLPAIAAVSYGEVRIKVKCREGDRILSVGHVLLTEAGEQLSRLCEVVQVPNLVDYVVSRWRLDDLANVEIEGEAGLSLSS